MGVLDLLGGGTLQGVQQLRSLFSPQPQRPQTSITPQQQQVFDRAMNPLGLYPTYQPTMMDKYLSGGSSPTQQIISSTKNVLGASSGGGGGDTRLQQLEKTSRNPAEESEYQRLLSQLSAQQGPSQEDLARQAEERAREQARIELENALTEYDRSAEELRAQGGQLDTQRLSSLGTVESEYGKAQKETERAKTEAQQTTRSAEAKALATAQDIQRKNRNVLRALGILSSSAGGEILSRPITEYGTQAAQLQQGLVDRLGKVEDWWMQRQGDFTKMKTDLESQYATLKENIARDLRFNDRQRTTAVKAAGAALNQRLGEIQNQAYAYQQAARQYSDNLLMQIAQIRMYQNPQADVSGILSTLLRQAQPAYQPQQVGIQQTDEQRRRLLSGLGT